MVAYNNIGKTYDTTRNADPFIVNTLIVLLNASSKGHYLDLACGSGNYTDAIAKAGFSIEGIDISIEMLSKAKVKNPGLIWHQGSAESLPFEKNRFDGAICTLATHHMHSFKMAFKEMYRVMKAGNFVVFTSTPEQMQSYWLCHYFPVMMEESILRMSTFSDLEQAFVDAGFVEIEQQPFFIENALTDWFLHSGKYRPEIYLDPLVRAGISSFALAGDKNEISQGLLNLKNDIDSGHINNIIEKYENKLGEYLFVVGKKK